MPTYYIMERDATMAETAATYMPSSEEIAACDWLTDDELGFYAGDFKGVELVSRPFGPRTHEWPPALFGRTIDVPAVFISGDWGVYHGLAPSRSCSSTLAATCGACIWSRVQVTGCSRSNAPRYVNYSLPSRSISQG